MDLCELQAKPCFRQTLAGDAVENRQCQKDQHGKFWCRYPAGQARYGVQDNAERGAEAFLREKVRIYILLHKVWMYAQNVKHDEPRQAHRPGNACIEGLRHPGIEFVAALDGRGQDRLSETESAPASTEEKTAVALRTPRDD